MRVFEGFAGYGGASFALQRYCKAHPECDYTIVGYSEIDKWASALYDANHKHKDGSHIKNWGDITAINTDELPEFDLFTGGFPCQPFSSAGMQLGEADPYGRGTLFYHIMRIIEAKRPQYILLENVKGLLSKKFATTFQTMQQMLSNLGYGDEPLKYAILNSKDYGIPQNRERVWMFAKLGGLPKDFTMEPPLRNNDLRLGDFLDKPEFLDHSLYLSDEQIAHLKVKHNIDSFVVDVPLCFDVYNKKIKRDGYSITLTQPEHNSLRVIEASKDRKEVVRKMSAAEQFRLMGLDAHLGQIDFAGQSYTQLSKRAGNGWDVNLVSILLEHIFNQVPFTL